VDSDVETMVQLFMQQEANATIERQQQLLILTNLLRFCNMYLPSLGVAA
jgi:hypothetical protein